MHDQGSARQGQVLDGAQVTVPEELWTRCAAPRTRRSVRRRKRSTWLRLRSIVKRTRSGLWTRGEAAGRLRVAGRDRLVAFGPAARSADRSAQGWRGLMRVLAGALEFADEDVERAARCEVEHAESDLAPEHHTEVERVGRCGSAWQRCRRVSTRWRCRKERALSWTSQPERPPPLRLLARGDPDRDPCAATRTCAGLARKARGCSLHARRGSTHPPPTPPARAGSKASLTVAWAGDLAAIVGRRSVHFVHVLG